jgi:chaperonin cofactor prefoldin
MGFNIDCDTCGKDITNMRNQAVHCDYCVDELKDKINTLENDIEALEKENNSLSNTVDELEHTVDRLERAT